MHDLPGVEVTPGYTMRIGKLANVLLGNLGSWHSWVTLICTTYLNVVADQENPFMAMVFLNVTDLYQQVNATCYTAKSVRNGLRNKWFKVFNSPDLIPLSICEMYWPSLIYRSPTSELTRLKVSAAYILLIQSIVLWIHNTYFGYIPMRFWFMFTWLKYSIKTPILTHPKRVLLDSNQLTGKAIKPVWNYFCFVTSCIIILEVAMKGCVKGCGYEGMHMVSNNAQRGRHIQVIIYWF